MHWANVKVRVVMPLYLLAIHGRSIIESESDLTMPCLCLEPVAPFYIRRTIHVAEPPTPRLGLNPKWLRYDASNPNSKQYSMNTFENNMFSSIIFLSLLDHVIIKGAWEHPGLTRSGHTNKFRNSGGLAHATTG